MFFSVLLCGHLMAQTRTIAGRVTDAKDGTPLPGVTVSIKGSSKGTITNSNGDYRLEVSQTGGTLVFSYIGYSNRELPMPAGGHLDVQLATDDKTLREVVVTGYVDIKKKEVTSSTASLDGGKVHDKPIQSFDQALKGQAAGVNVNVTSGILGDAVAIRIRGVNSISNSSSPLIVVDGIPLVSGTNLTTFNGGNGTRYNPLADINPNDIETIDILKDAAAAALYGSRAANGVIVITTRRGKQGTITATYNGNFTWAKAARLPKLLNGDDFTTIQNEKAANLGLGPIAVDYDPTGSGKPARTDWLKQVFQTGFTQNHNVSVSGGTEKAQFYGSMDYIDAKGIVFTNRLRRGSVRLNLDVTPKTWFKVGVNLYASKGLNNGVLSDGLLAGATVAGYNAPPNVPVYNTTGDYGGFYLSAANRDLGNGNNVNVSTNRLNRFFHPLATLLLGRNDNISNRTSGGIYGELSPIKGLKITSRFGVDFIQDFEDQYSGPDQAGLGFNFNGLVQENLVRNNQWNWSNFATYTRTFAEKHTVALTAGVEYQYRKRIDLYTGQGNLTDSYFQSIYDGLSAGTGNTFAGGTANADAFDSYFGRLAYNYKGKYYVEGALRADAFSGFGIDNRRGYFPSVSAGWRVSEEAFFRDHVKVINDLKIRASYGKVGNANVGPYPWRTLYGGGQYAELNGLSMAQIGDPTLKWETSKKLDIGFDAALLRSRLTVTFDYFKNNVDGLVLSAPVYRTTGIPGAAVITNIGAMWNQGYELTVTATPIDKRGLTWTTSANFTALKNKVTQLATPDDLVSGSNRASIGRPLGVFYMIRWAGVDPNTGYGMFYAKDGSIRRYNPSPGLATADRWTTQDGSSKLPGITGADAVYLEGKTGYPTWYGGWTNTLTYKGIELGITLQFSGGNWLLNATRQGLMTNFFNNNIDEIKSRWTPTNKNTITPKLVLRENVTTQTSTRWLEKADYLRVQEIVLAYTFPTVKKMLGVSTFRVFGSVNNAFLLTGYSGQDPDINTNRQANIAFGVDSRGVPLARTFVLGLRAGF